ncbi:hypothetical protein [uncultured Pontibacter sp.]|uniref:hypothetical protein n=1 Tax=uncultured Pontibacter sp. TaxID=453356 RepID=UPI002607C9AA|nr:hypothetical protein [uncultured Pontibacter sp.]
MEYVKIIKNERSKLKGIPVDVYYDSNLLYDTYLFNHRLYKEQDLYHYNGTICEECVVSAELCGYSTQDEYKDIKELANAIYDNFKDSPRHHAIQMDEGYSYISISYISNYYVVRLASFPHNVVGSQNKSRIEFEKLVR